MSFDHFLQPLSLRISVVILIELTVSFDDFWIKCGDIYNCFDIFSQTGLSGSSAIVCAALSCLLDFYDVRHLIKVEVRPNLVLNAEKELGIVAGLQDRVAQVYGGLVYMVCSFVILKTLILIFRI